MVSALDFKQVEINIDILLYALGLNVSNQIIPLPITPLSNLMWIGFTDVGSLATYDSGGIVRINRLNSGTWIPVCDTTVHVCLCSTYFSSNIYSVFIL